MTREEAIQDLKDILEEATSDKDAVCYVTSEDAEALNMAIEALSAEAVQGEWTYLSGSKGSYMTISCPICGSTFNGVEEWKYHYCPNCGSRMDKGGEDE